MNRIAELLTRGFPVLVGSVDDSFDEAFPSKIAASGLDVVELRIDRFARQTPAQVVETARAFASIPTCATIRSRAEGGAWTHDEETRLALFRAVAAHVEAIDIELSATDIVVDVVRAARDADRQVLVSFHDFVGMPGRDRLTAIIERAQSLRPDVIKLAVPVSGLDDLKVLASLQVENGDVPLVTIGMGSKGISSRLLFPFLSDAPLVYCDLGMGNAPGQLPFRKVFETMRILSPQFDENKAAQCR